MELYELYMEVGFPYLRIFLDCPEMHLYTYCVPTNINRYHPGIQLSNSFVIHRWTGDYMAKK